MVTQLKDITISVEVQDEAKHLSAARATNTREIELGKSNILVLPFWIIQVMLPVAIMGTIEKDLAAKVAVQVMMCLQRCQNEATNTNGRLVNRSHATLPSIMHIESTIKTTAPRLGVIVLRPLLRMKIFGVFTRGSE